MLGCLGSLRRVLAPVRVRRAAAGAAADTDPHHRPDVPEVPAARLAAPLVALREEADRAPG